MSKARPTAYQKFYWSDFFADTAELDGVQTGVYQTLIGRYWVKGEPLTDNDNVLARLTRLTLDQWMAIRPALEQFFVIANGEWRHNRIEHDLAEAIEAHAKAVESGRRGGKARQPQATLEQPSRQPQASLKQPEPEPTPEPKKEKTLAPAALALDGFDDFWSAYSRRDSRRNAEKAWPAALKKVGGDPSVIVRAAKAYSRQFVTGAKDKQYQAMAASWLNGERWADQPLTAPVMDSEAAEEARKLREAEYLRISLEESKNNKPLFAPWMKD